MKNLIFYIVFISIAIASNAQPPALKSGAAASYISFIELQRKLTRPGEALKKKEDTLQKQFAVKGLKWPVKYMYIRDFKYDGKLEVWVKNEVQEKFQLFKTYRVCALAGTLGPKRMEGDYQVPEGFYFINEFNPNSTYYLSLGINYPNASDRILSDSDRPGSAIYIHGSCVTVGCIPITDQQIDELYILSAHAKDQGQDFIPVHIFPIRYNIPKSEAYLATLTKDDPALKRFSDNLEDAYNYFEKHKQLPVVLIGERGEYIINDPPPKRKAGEKEEPKPRKPAMQHRTRDITGLANSVHQWPQFPGGGDSFTKYLKELGHELAGLLPEGVSKTYLQVEFIVDKDGTPTNFKLLKGAYMDDIGDELIIRMEKMPTWQPAMLNDKPVPKKMVQTVTIEAK